MKFFPSLSPLLGAYDGFILDLWGVVHDGSALYPGVKEALVEMKAQEKRVVFLSNAPRRASKVVEVLSKLGIDESLYVAAVSSGEAAHAWMATQLPAEPCFFMGPGRDAHVMEGLPHARVSALAEAKHIVCAGYEDGETDADVHDDFLKEARAHGLPLICINPDIEVVKQTGERWPCAGILAAKYETLGGAVRYFGKPYPDVYAICLAKFTPIDKGRILAVGDTLGTDIKGATHMGIDSALITGGVLKDMLGDPVDEEKLHTLSMEAGAVPAYVLPALKC